LSFSQSPQPRHIICDQRVDLFFNGTKLSTVARNGVGLGAFAWQVTTYTVTRTGRHVISSRENDRDHVGGLLDNVRLIAVRPVTPRDRRFRTSDRVAVEHPGLVVWIAPLI
jgi:hypothetical protein